MSYRSNYLFLLAVSIGLAFTSCNRNVPLTAPDMEYITNQTRLLTEEMEKIVPAYAPEEKFTDTVYSVGPMAAPRSVRDGKLFTVPSRDWTSGFFPGNLWFMFELTGDAFWKQKAIEFTSRIEREKLNDGTHDMGFKINCSFGNGFRLTGDTRYREIMVESATTLMKRFNPVVGATLSWGAIRQWGDTLTAEDHEAKWLFPVIIDNMMNLELLFLATAFTGDSTYYHAAVKHAETTMKHHYREDNSSYHVIDFNPITGEVRNKHTHQGAAHESAWARGQAWGLYGFTMCHRFTGKPEFLQQAEKIAEFLIHHPNLPEDLVPYWDYDAPSIPDEPRDASAAALIASALYELSTFLPEKSDSYKTMADRIHSSLSKSYYNAPGANYGFILDHSTGHLPGDHEIDGPLIYADYYYLEAELRKRQLQAASVK